MSGEFFVMCDCGKEREVRPPASVAANEDELALYRSLAGRSACHACEVEMSMALDACPEMVTLPNGFAACRLSWAHTGRCEPYPAPPSTPEENP